MSSHTRHTVFPPCTYASNIRWINAGGPRRSDSPPSDFDTTSIFLFKSSTHSTGVVNLTFFFSSSHANRPSRIVAVIRSRIVAAKSEGLRFDFVGGKATGLLKRHEIHLWWSKAFDFSNICCGLV